MPRKPRVRDDLRDADAQKLADLLTDWSVGTRRLYDASSMRALMDQPNADVSFHDNTAAAAVIDDKTHTVNILMLLPLGAPKETLKPVAKHLFAQINERNIDEYLIYGLFPGDRRGKIAADIWVVEFPGARVDRGENGGWRIGMTTFGNAYKATLSWP